MLGFEAEYFEICLNKLGHERHVTGNEKNMKGNERNMQGTERNVEGNEMSMYTAEDQLKEKCNWKVSG